jgi:triacylglycerol lipase
MSRWSTVASLPILCAALACASPPTSTGDLRPAAERGVDRGREADLDASQPGSETGIDRGLGYGPPYPIVLAHGFFGFDKIGPVEYWWKLKPALQGAGHEVYIPTVNPFQGTAVRGEQLLSQVKAILAQSGSAKVNLIGHSQGGFDVRYVAAKLPDRIGAVVTVATPHLGARVADVILGRAPGFSIALGTAFAAVVGRPLWGEISDDPDLKASLESLSTEGATAFNVSYPDLPEVRYYSLTGRSSRSLATSECFAPKAPPFVTQYAGVKDPIEPLLFPIAQLLNESLIDPIPNDGMVQVASAKWGTWLGCIPADHMDEVGQLLGDRPGIGNSFDHLAFYRDLAAFLVSQGF